MLQIYRELPEMVRRDFDYDVTVYQGDQSGKLAVYNHTMEYSFDFEIDEDGLRDESIAFRVGCDKQIIKRFDAKNFKLTKIQ